MAFIKHLVETEHFRLVKFLFGDRNFAHIADIVAVPDHVLCDKFYVRSAKKLDFLLLFDQLLS